MSNRKLNSETAEQVNLVERWFGSETPSVEHYDDFYENMVELKRAEGGEWDIPSEEEFLFAVNYLVENL
jgi:hypothetical protein